MQPASRLRHIKPYFFSSKMAQIKQMLSEGFPVINLGIGNPDLPPPPQVIKVMREAVNNLNTHGYQPYKGLSELRQAIANFYQKHYKVSLNPDTEILPLFGSKEGVMHVSMAFLDKSDQVLVPNPGYSTYQVVSELMEAEVIPYDLTDTNGWQPNFDSLEQLDLTRVKIMWTNYPHMPTGTKATQELFQKLVAFGKKHHILIINDNPYSFVLSNNPISIMSVDGSKDTAIELNSLSKTFNMAGWRIGMLIGQKAFVDNVFKVKSNMDSGMFHSLQMGAIEALQSEQNWFDNMNTVYRKRRETVWKIADLLGLTYDDKAEGLFVWAKLPDGQKSHKVSDDLLDKHHVFVTPGSIFGKNGQNYLRFSLCVNEKTLEEVKQRLTKIKP